MSLNTTKLLASINLKGELPEGKFTNEEILDLAYDVLISDVQPLIVDLKEEYYVKRAPYAITGSQSYYRIPDRALAQKLREVKIIRGGNYVDIPQIDTEQLRNTSLGVPQYFFLESNYVRLYPTPQSTVDTLELSYYLRCSKLVQSSEVGVITGIDRATGIVTASTPSTWTTANSFDLTSRKNAGESLARDLVATSVTTTSINFSISDLTDELAVGDYVSLAGESFTIQIPDEVVPLLTMLTVVECLNSMGSLQEMQAAQAKAEQLRGQVVTLLTSRVIGAAQRRRPMV